MSQTTFNYKKFNKLVEILSKKRYDILVLNTICNATEERQQEARKIAADVDAMIVIEADTVPIRRNYLKYVKKNARILTIYRHLKIWMYIRCSP